MLSSICDSSEAAKPKPKPSNLEQEDQLPPYLNLKLRLQRCLLLGSNIQNLSRSKANSRGKGGELLKSKTASDNRSVELASLQLRYNQEGCFNVWRRLDFMHATVTALSELLALPTSEHHQEQVEDEIQHEGSFPEASQGEHVQVQLPQEEAKDENISDTVAQEEEEAMTTDEKGKKQAKDKGKKPAKEKNKKPAAEEKIKNPTAENKNPAEEKNKKQATEKNKNPTKQ